LKGWASFYDEEEEEEEEGPCLPYACFQAFVKKKKKKKPSGIEQETCVLNFFLSSIWLHPNMIFKATFFLCHSPLSKNSLLNFLENFH